MAKKSVLNVKEGYENLFIRIPSEKKHKLREKARLDGKTISVVMREFVDLYLNRK